MTNDERSFELRGVVYREGPHWLAHCLELDIVAEGASPQDAVKTAIELCEFQIETAIENSDVESIFRPAPARIWNLFFSKTKKLSVPAPREKRRLRKFEARELVMA